MNLVYIPAHWSAFNSRYLIEEPFAIIRKLIVTDDIKIGIY